MRSQMIMCRCDESVLSGIVHSGLIELLAAGDRDLRPFSLLSTETRCCLLQDLTRLLMM
jgi:hypothetical protein